MDRRELLKPSRFGNAEKRRLVDSKNLREQRSLRRTNNFNLHRQIVPEVDTGLNENVPVPPKFNKLIDRKLALQKFKAEKEAEKKAQQERKKPPFVVGIPHHGSSPLLRNANASGKNKKEIQSTANAEVRTRVTRASTRAIKGNVLKEKPKNIVQPKKVPAFKAPPSVKVFPFKDSKTVFSFQAKQTHSVKKLTSPHTPTVLKRSAQKKPLRNISNLAIKSQEKPENSKECESDEVLAAPLASVTEEKKNHTEIVNSDQQETSGMLSTPPLVSPVFNDIKPTEEVLNQDNKDDEITYQVEFQKLNLSNKSQEKPENSKECKADEVLAAPLASVTEEKKNHTEIVNSDQQETSEMLSTFPSASPEINVINTNEDVLNQENRDDEITNQVVFQNGRIQTETKRLLGMAEQWQAIVLRDTLPDHVVDEVDSLVGQTRLLTSDKFQQFRRLVVQYEQRTGTHPITLDDLNGFWDMVYLQVESLDKRYTALDSLKNNNWVMPEPERKKKRRPAKKPTKKESEKLIKIKDSLKPESKEEPIQTPTTSVKPVISSVLLNRNRTRSNSPSPYIAMRLSGIGRPSSALVHQATNDLTPKSKLASPESFGTPKSARKNNWKKLTESTKKRRSLLSTIPSPADIKIEENENTEVRIKIEKSVDTKDATFEETFENEEHETADENVPPITPRRSMRLMAKVATPASCLTCEASSCKKSGRNICSHSPKTRRSMKVLKFSPSTSEQNRKTESNSEETTKPSTSRVRFSLRPSVLTISENSVTEMPKKAAKRRQTTYGPSSSIPAEHASPRRRTPRLTRKVTFDREADEKVSFKLPSTPYRKLQTDS
ncbi:disks large-associated protein 5-like isoform X3 [Macrosteles quadrilineatus]|uniref:disks large-associated protein 5-like isoform X3 n=1 Tax=Macrosteles quadrilineatus TaxID=74068 RepID=UPI0023E1FEDC|nr:disks large-associated protein 5-like isoform X3 [Macrosteles quadrilineatus]